MEPGNLSLFERWVGAGGASRKEPRGDEKGESDSARLVGGSS